MNVPRTLTAISLDHDRLCAVHGSVTPDRIKIKSWLSVAAPAGTDLRDAGGAGSWIAAELDKAGMGRGRLVFAIPRSEVVLKKLKLPKGEGAGETELAGMVRLQMTRQLTMAVEGTAIDYTPIGEQQGGVFEVLAGALPGERMSWYRDVAKAAGCKIDRLGLRAAGLAALLSGASQRHAGPVMGVGAGWGSVEFVVVEDGQLVFARSADVGMADPGGEQDQSFIARAAVEAKRTWMSYRGAEGSAEVEAVLVPGSGAFSLELGQKCGEAVEMPAERVPLPAIIELPDIPEVDLLVLAPLVGLLGEESLARTSIDFANPHKAPDLAAARRQRALAVVLAAIVLGGGGYVLSLLQLDRLRADVKAAESAGADLRKKDAEFLMESARLGHLQQWLSAKVDWTAHLAFLSDQMPDPRQALMDQVSGVLKAAVEQVPTRSGVYDPKGWRIAQQAAFSLQGHAKQREIANGLRERLLAASDVYTQVESTGPDTPDQFSLTLTTAAESPETARAAPPPKTVAPSKGAQK
jgi:hypothetical protein